MDTKKWYLSKTLWFNTLTVLAAALTALAGVDVSPQAAEALTMAVAIVNFFLRLITSQTIE